MKKFKNLYKTYEGLPKEIYIISIARFINAAGMFIFPLLTLLLTKKIGLSGAEAGFWIAMSGVSTIPMSIIGGHLTDIIGRKKIIIIPNIIAAILFMSCSFIEPSMLMVYLIIAGGAVLNASFPAMSSLIGDITTPKNRNASFSLSYLGNNLGFAVGPFVGGMLFNNHLKLFFFIDALTTLIAAIIIFAYVKETYFEAKENATSELEKTNTESVFKVLLTRKTLLIFSLLSFGYHFSYSQWSFLMPIHLESLFTDKGAEYFGILASLNGLVVIIFTPLITALLSKLNDLTNATIGGLLYMIGFGILGFFEMKFAFVLCVFIFTLGEITLVISTMPYITNHTPVNHRGKINSILNIIMGAGHFIGPVIVGKLLFTISIPSVWKIVSFVVLLSSIGMYILQIYEKNTNIKGLKE